MKANSPSGRQTKYAWRELGRVDAPKRSASERIFDFSQTDDLYDEATASEQAARCVQCPDARCTEACPLGVPIPELMALTADCRFDEASALLLSAHSLPEVFTHVCAGKSLCEAACVLDGHSDPVPVSSVSRFLLAHGRRRDIPEPASQPANGQKVAILGSGICGLVGAEALSRRGYAVTVMDCHQKPGGRMMNGLPGFRVDPKLMERRVELLRQRGVQFQMGVVCGKDVSLGRLRQDFDALFFGLGRADAVPLDVPGANLRGVQSADIFVQANTANVAFSVAPLPVRGRRVVVLGGGDTAMDALRVAIRLGASEAVGLYRRDRETMPANPDDCANAIEEGARFLFHSQAVEILGNAARDAISVRCVRTEPAAPASSTRPAVKPVVGSEFDIPADVVLVAYGFAPPRLPCQGEFGELAMDARGCLIVDADQMTNLPGVFAGGSIVRGPAPLAEVVRDARQAALAIDRYLSERRSSRAGVAAG